LKKNDQKENKFHNYMIKLKSVEEQNDFQREMK